MMNFNFMYYLMLMIIMFLYLLMFIPSNLYKFHPLSLGMLLVAYTMFLSFSVNMLGSSFWYSYVLFLVMIGGLMILFMYFTGLANNQLFMFNKNYYMFLMGKVLFFTLMFLYFMMNNDMMGMFLNNLFNEINELKLFNDNSDYLYLIKNLLMDYLLNINIYMILYMFFTMISSILLCQKMMIPLRQMIIVYE